MGVLPQFKTCLLPCSCAAAINTWELLHQVPVSPATGLVAPGLGLGNLSPGVVIVGVYLGEGWGGETILHYCIVCNVCLQDMHCSLQVW